MRIFSFIILLTLSNLVYAESENINSISLCKDGKISKIIVYKHDREMILMCEDFYQIPITIKKYTIMLGREPIGPKQQEGDNKTPEGIYKLDWKHPNSSYYRSLHVSYPNEEDKENARRLGIENPGGDIMVHGMPNKMAGYDFEKYPETREIAYQTLYYTDWTAGCIAVTNPEILEIYNQVQTPIKIEINP